MNTDDFEKRMEQQPLRPVPAQWREEILRTAKVSAASSTSARSAPSTLTHQLSTLFWPHPRAWAALAAVWVVIIGTHWMLRDATPARSMAKAPPHEVIATWREQKRLLVQLTEPSPAPRPAEAERPKSNSAPPHSERRRELIVV